jgi:cytosine/uracil/thiamine/allantoin permease
LFTALFAKGTHWWALIPAGIIALIGFGALGNTIATGALEYLEYVWPVGLMAFGLYLIVRRGFGGRAENRHKNSD